MAGLDEVTRRLRRELGDATVIDDRQELRTYECDGLAHYKVVPGLAVLAQSTADVVATVRACAEHGVPFVARGSGTGLSGGALPHADGVLVVTSRMRAVRAVDRDAQRAVVQPGVINLQVTRAAAAGGYYYAPDPSSQQVCSIGGNVAENSGGAHCLKYGFTTNHVRRGGRAGREGAGPARVRPARHGRRLRGHARHRHPGDRAAGTRAGVGPHAAGRLRRHRRRRAGGVGDHRRRGDPGRGGDDGRPGDRGGRGGGALRLPGRRGRRAGGGAGRAGRRGGRPVRRRGADVPAGRSVRAASGRGRRRAGAVLEGPQVRVRRGRPDQPGLHRPGRGDPADRAAGGAAGDRCTVDGLRRAGGERLPRRRRQPAPAGALRRDRGRRGGAGRGGLRRDPRPVPGARRVDHRRARRRLGQGQAHAPDVQRRGPGHHAAGAVRVRPGRAVQPRQGVPHAAAVRGGARPAPRRAPAGGGRPGGAVLMPPSRRSWSGRPVQSSGLVDPTEIGAELAAATGGHAAAAGAADAVAGVPARWVAAPGSTAEAAAVLRVAAGHRLAVAARGAGTKLGWGTPPDRLDLLVDTARLDRVVEHAAGDLVVVVQPGVPLAELADRLAADRQQLAVDEVVPGTTVGGMLATGLSGPRRLLAGAVRDLVLGVTLVRADGVVARAGGKVVKNVAGYDLAKLICGAYGTLGLVTEAAFRLHPVPEAAAYAAVTAGSPAQAYAAVQRVLHAQFVPSAVELDRPAAAGPVQVAVLVEGTAAGVAARTGQALAALGPGAAEVDRPAWWGRLPGPPEAGDVLVKLTTELAGLTRLLDGVTAAAGGLPVAVRGSAGVGV